MNERVRDQLQRCETEDQVRAWIGDADGASAKALEGMRRIEAIRHAEMRPPIWYKHPATWIAIASIIVAILGWLFPRH
jgi:hypothetical protein